MTKQELIKIVEICWQAACEARMAGVKDMFDEAFTVPHEVCGPRYMTYQTLLSALVPKTLMQQSEVTVRETKEPWEG